MLFRGIDALTIVDVEESHVTWWVDKGSSVLRLVNILTIRASMSATGTVIDRNGNVRPDPPPLPLAWGESFRYYRLSQITNDLFDAYRNVYLALESILSEVVPKKQREGEGEWVKRAFKDVHEKGLVDFSRVMHQSEGSSWEVAYQELYKDKRNAIFHAKNHHAHLLPHGLEERDALRASLKRLASVYLTLTGKYLGVRPPSGGIHADGFKRITDQLDDRFEIHVTDDDTSMRRDDTYATLADMHHITLPTCLAPEYDRPLTHFFLGALPVRRLSSLSHIGRIAYTCNNTLLASNRFEGNLTLDGMDQFEVQVGIRLENTQQPREIYST